MRVFALAWILTSLMFTTAAIAQSDQHGIVSNMEDNNKADLVDDLGVGWVRITAYWRAIETSKGVYSWSGFDAQINRATSRNLKIFITIHETPGWANGGQAAKVPPTNSIDFGDFCFAIASRYKTNSLVKAYGMWNEPNLSAFWSGTRQQYQTKILVPGSQKIHQAKSALLVGAPEISHHWTSGSTWNLGTLLDTAGAQVDIATVHFYPDWSTNPNGFATYLDSYVKPNRRGKAVWVTEISQYGCPSDLCSLDNQSHYYTYIVSSQTSRSILQIS